MDDTLPINFVNDSDQLSFEFPLIEDSVSEAESDDSFLTTMSLVETNNKNKMLQFSPFGKVDPEFWFTWMESVFEIHGVSKDDLKFSYMLAQAPEELFTAAKNTPPSGQTKYSV